LSRAGLEASVLPLPGSGQGPDGGFGKRVLRGNMTSPEPMG
jgi:hypothetical protein